MPPYIVIAEDDHLQEGPLEDQLLDRFPTARVETVTSESEFRDRLPAYRADPPDLVIMDMMLKWARQRPGVPKPPSDVAAGGYYRAGMRCTRILRDEHVLSRVPVIVYTILERSDIERDDASWLAGIDYVRKSSDLDLIGRRVQRLLSI